MTGESFDGTLLLAAFAAFVTIYALTLVFGLYAVLDSIRNPPKKRVDQHPEW